MSFLIGLLTVVLVVTGLFLGLLVLIQLPKKEAGVGAAFGGGMTDTIMGAGSGNVLTAATRYSAGIFLVVALSLSIILTHEKSDRSKSKSFSSDLEKAAATIPAAKVTPPPALVTNVTPAAPAKPADSPFPGATPTAPGESLFPGATPTAPADSPFPGATPTSPGESLFPGATPTAPSDSPFPGATPTSPK